MKHLVTIFLFAAALTKAQTFDVEMPVGQQNIFTKYVYEENDSGYIFFNHVYDTTSGKAQFTLTRTDKWGNQGQTKTSNIRNESFLFSKMSQNNFVNLTPSSWFLSGSRGIGGKWTAFLCKVNKTSLDTELVRIYQHPTLDAYGSLSAHRLGSNKFLLPVQLANSTQAWPLLVVLDSNLNHLGEIPVNTQGFSNTHSLRHPLSGKIVLGGITHQVPGQTHVLNTTFVECDTLGVITNSYVSPMSYSLTGFLTYSAYDNTYLCAGIQILHQYAGTGWYKINLSKYDSAFNLVWRKSYGPMERGVGVGDVITLADGSIVLCGSIRTFVNAPMGDGFAFILKVDKHGNPLWMRRYDRIFSYAIMEGLHSVRETFDGGLVFCGNNISALSPLAWLLKTGPDGCLLPGCASLSVTVDSNLKDPPKPPPDTSTTALRQGFQEPGLTVFPNPFTNRVSVHLPSPPPGAWRLLLRDQSGRTLRQLNESPQAAFAELDLSDLDPGLYLLEVSGEGLQARHARLIKEP